MHSEVNTYNSLTLYAHFTKNPCNNGTYRFPTGAELQFRSVSGCLLRGFPLLVCINPCTEASSNLQPLPSGINSAVNIGKCDVVTGDSISKYRRGGVVVDLWLLNKAMSIPRAEGSGDRIPVEKRFSVPVQIGPGAHPASYKMGTVFLSRGKAAVAWR